MLPAEATNIIYVLDLVGTFAFAISGSLSAIEKKFDLFGVLFIGFITAIGGGSTRDLLLGATPVAWMRDINYFYAILLGTITTIVFLKYVWELKKTLFIFDTIGIAVFTIIGLEKALVFGIYIPMAIAMGMVSSVVGGILRDVFCNDIPLIFHREIYATPCIIGGLIFVLLNSFNINQELNTIITVITIITIRTLSVKYNWSLPRISHVPNS